MTMNRNGLYIYALMQCSTNYVYMYLIQLLIFSDIFAKFAVALLHVKRPNK